MSYGCERVTMAVKWRSVIGGANKLLLGRDLGSI